MECICQPCPECGRKAWPLCYRDHGLTLAPEQLTRQNERNARLCVSIVSEPEASGFTAEQDAAITPEIVGIIYRTMLEKQCEEITAENERWMSEIINGTGDASAPVPIVKHAPRVMSRGTERAVEDVNRWLCALRVGWRLAQDIV